MDATTLPLGRPAPDSLALTVGQGVLEAGLAYRALAADRLGLPGVILVGRRVKDLDYAYGQGQAAAYDHLPTLIDELANIVLQDREANQ